VLYAANGNNAPIENCYTGTDHTGTDHTGTDHTGTDHTGTDHTGTAPAAARNNTGTVGTRTPNGKITNRKGRTNFAGSIKNSIFSKAWEFRRLL
jgi:hypothetical protein